MISKLAIHLLSVFTMETGLFLISQEIALYFILFIYFIIFSAKISRAFYFLFFALRSSVTYEDDGNRN